MKYNVKNQSDIKIRKKTLQKLIPKFLCKCLDISLYIYEKKIYVLKGYVKIYVKLLKSFVKFENSLCEYNKKLITFWQMAFPFFKNNVKLT